MIERQKKCRTCKKIFPLSGYYKKTRMADGHMSDCKKCQSLAVKTNNDKTGYQKQYRAKNKEKIADYGKQWRADHPDYYIDYYHKKLESQN